jgi:hypothetical protein
VSTVLAASIGKLLTVHAPILALIVMALGLVGMVAALVVWIRNRH